MGTRSFSTLCGTPRVEPQIVEHIKMAPNFRTTLVPVWSWTEEKERKRASSATTAEKERKRASSSLVDNRRLHRYVDKMQ